MPVSTPDEFLAPSLRHHYALYVIRKLLFHTINAHRSRLEGHLVDVGCGQMPYRNFLLGNNKITTYTGVDWPESPYHAQSPPDVYWDGKTLPFKNCTADCCLATEVFEHLSNATQVAAEIHRILKPGGILFLTVPFFWPFHEVPYDEYRYTPFSLKRILSEAGFSSESIQIGAIGGWLSTLAQVIAQVISIEVSSPYLRGALKRMSIPLIEWLVKKDRPPVEFSNHSMALGLYVVATKHKES